MFYILDMHFIRDILLLGTLATASLGAPNERTGEQGIACLDLGIHRPATEDQGIRDLVVLEFCDNLRVSRAERKLPFASRNHHGERIGHKDAPYPDDLAYV